MNHRNEQSLSKSHRGSFLLAAGLLLCTVVLFSATGLAQTASTGALSGTVTDPSGAVVPDATIKVISEATGETHTVTSKSDGVYVAPLLAPGRYRVEAEAQGFKTGTKTDLNVAVTDTTTFNIQLAVGAASQSVTVHGAAAMVQTETSALGRVVDERAVVGLPLVTRNYTDLLALSPGVNTNVPDATQIGNGTGGTTGTFTPGAGVYVNGVRSYENNFQMNGIDINDLQNNGSFSGGVAVPNPDTLKEFKVQTGLYDAEYGRNAGANVDVVTKSGTNQFHGTLFEFFRNEVLNANDYFFKQAKQKRGELRQNQYGFTLGGPAIKDKLLFFGSFQGTRQANGIVPGGFAEVFGPPLTNDRSAATLGALFGGQSGAFGGTAVAHDGSNISPQALALLQMKLSDGSYMIPTPKKVDPSQPFSRQGFSLFSAPNTFNENQYMANVDYLQNAKSKFEVRFFTASDQLTNPLTSNVPGWPGGQHNGFQNASITHTYSFSANLYNEVEAGYHRIYAVQGPSAPPLFTFSGIGTTVPAQANSLPNISIAGSYSFGAPPVDSVIQNGYNLQDTLFYARGKHTLSAGGGLSYGQNNVAFENNAGLTFFSFPDFLLGLSADQNGSFASNIFFTGTTFGFPHRNLRIRGGSLFLQDNYKATSRLTFNLGLRYERIEPFSDTSGKDANFYPALADPNPSAAGSIKGYVVASNFKGPVPADVARLGGNLVVRGVGQNTFGPRLGFSWQVLPDSPSVVLRGGYGIYYSQLPAQTMFQLNFYAPYGGLFFGSNPAATFSNPFPQAPPLSSFPMFTPYTSANPFAVNVAAISPDFRPTMTQQYTLNVQSQLARDLLFELGYVGTRGEHLIEGLQTNQALLASSANPIRGVTTNTVANIQSRVPFAGFSPTGINGIDTEASSWYNGLNASLTKRFDHSLQFLAAYTWGKALDTDAADSDNAGSQTTYPVGDSTNPRARYGRTDYDRTHRFVFSGVYELPLASDKAGLKGKVLGGWEASGVATIQSGQALTIVFDNATNLYGSFLNTAQLAPGCSNADVAGHGAVSKRLNQYFNAACLTTVQPIIGGEEPAGTCSNPLPDGNCPAIGTGFGNSGVGIVTGPGQQSYDLALMKHTSLPWPDKGANIEFRTEFFNAFNHAQFGPPDTNFSDPTFGQITTTSVGPRIIQFALKLNY